jgi:hypothetical protein
MHSAVTPRSRFRWRGAAPTAAGAYLGLTLLMALLLPTQGAAAADAIFPIGSRLGLVPPAGMVPSRTFQGFEEPGTKAAIVLTTLPANAYEQLAKSMVPEAMKKEGIDVERRDPVELPAGKGFVLTGRQTVEKERYRKWLLAFGQIVGIKDVQLQDAGPLRIASQPGYQTLAKAKDAGTGADVMVVQWLRFGSGGFLRMIGIARADAWPEMFGRLRTVRDSVAAN